MRGSRGSRNRTFDPPSGAVPRKTSTADQVSGPGGAPFECRSCDLSSRAKRRREREQRSRQTEMSEEQMMEEALRRSEEEEEARAAALRLQQVETNSAQSQDAVWRRSPVFPSSGCRAEVWVDPLDQELLQSCRTSGFVRWSQDTWTPQSPAPPGAGGRSPVFGGTAHQDEDGVNGSPGEWAELGAGASESLTGSNRVSGPETVSGAEPGEPDGTRWAEQSVTPSSDPPSDPPSPVFPQDQQSEGVEPQHVHYYWGVPFCPAGLDPDVYTQVIVTQFEVQEKSLKRAQRCLLNKAPWGPPILAPPMLAPPTSDPPENPASPESPQPPVASRLRMRKRRVPSEEEEEEEEDGVRVEDEHSGGAQVETDCEVCPETQLSSDSVQELEPQTRGGRDQPLDTSPTLHTVSRDSSADEEQQEQQEEVEEVQEEEHAPAEAEEVEEQRGGPDVEEVEEQQGGPDVEEPPPAVDCPLCQRPFPVDHIELHAAYCDGEAGPDSRVHVKVKPRRGRMRMVDLSAEDTSDLCETDRVQQEKCYVCQKDVDLSEYRRHTERCIHMHKSTSVARGGLLLALQQTESRDSDAGPSRPRMHLGDVVDLRDEDEDQDQVGTFRPLPQLDSGRRRARKPGRRQR